MDKRGIPKGLPISGSLSGINSIFKTTSSLTGRKEAPIDKKGMYSVTSAPTMWYSPELTTESWLLPKSRQEILKWIRVFFNLDPYVQSITMMHAYYPFSKFDIITPDKDVTEFYKEVSFSGTFDLFQFILQASLSYEKFGECLTGDTLVPLLDGRTLSITELMKLKDFSNVYTYSLNEKNLIVPGKVNKVWCKGKNQVIKITLDNGKSFRCTKEHPVMVRKGTFTKARDLKVGDSIMPLYREKKDLGTETYETVYNPGKNSYEFTHRLIKWYSEPDTRGKIIHHVDFNPLNNAPENLIVLSQENHRSLHSNLPYNVELHTKLMKKVSNKYWSDPKNKKEQSDRKKELYKDPVEREKLKEYGIEVNNRPERKQLFKEVVTRYFDEHTSEFSKKIQTVWDSRDENYRKEHGKKIKDFRNSLTSEEVKVKYHTEEVGKKISTWWSTLTSEEKTQRANHANEMKRLKKQQNLILNHKIVSIEEEGIEDVYDIEIDKYHNFALDCGTFVHNSICFGNMQFDDVDKLYKWSKFILLEPELVEVKQDIYDNIPSFELIPTEEMKNIVTSVDPINIERQQRIPEVVHNAIKNGRNIPLDTELTSMIARITDPSAIRGTSAIQSLFKVLIYQDWIRLARAAYAQRYVFPIEVWTIGDLEKKYIPTDTDLEYWRGIINQAVQQPPFTMVVPPLVKYEAMSTFGKTQPLDEGTSYIQDQIMVGLGVNKNLIMGEGPSFSNMKAIALHKLIMMYKVKRDLFENWMINRFFRPLAEKNNFYMTVRGKKKLILPQISWYKSLDVEEEEAEKTLYQELHAKGYVSTKTLFSKFPNLDFATEAQNLEKEKGTVFDKEDKRIPSEFSKAEESSAHNLGEPPSLELPSETSAPVTPETTAPVAPETVAPIVPEIPATPTVPETPSATPGTTPV